MTDQGRHDTETDPLPYGLREQLSIALRSVVSTLRETRPSERTRESRETDAEPCPIGAGERYGLVLLALLHGPGDALSTLLAHTSGMGAETNPILRPFLLSAVTPRNGSPIAEYVILVGLMILIAAIGTDLLRKLRVGPIEQLRAIDERSGRAAARLWSAALAGLVGLGIVVVGSNLWIALS